MRRSVRREVDDAGPAAGPAKRPRSEDERGAVTKVLDELIRSLLGSGVGLLLDFAGNERGVLFYVSRDMRQLVATDPENPQTTTQLEFSERRSVRRAAVWALDSASVLELLRITTAREAVGAALFIRCIDDAANLIVKWLRYLPRPSRPARTAATIDAYNAAVHVLLEYASSRNVMEMQHKREVAGASSRSAGRIAPAARQLQKESSAVYVEKVFREHLNEGSAEQLLSWISEGAPFGATLFTRFLLPFHRDGEECLINRCELTRRCLSAPSAAAIADVVTAAIREADVLIDGAGESRSVLTSPLNEAIALLRFLSIAVKHLTNEEPFRANEDQLLRHSTDLLRAVRLVKVRCDAAAEELGDPVGIAASGSQSLTDEQQYVCNKVESWIQDKTWGVYGLPDEDGLTVDIVHVETGSPREFSLSGSGQTVSLTFSAPKCERGCQGKVRCKHSGQSALLAVDEYGDDILFSPLAAHFVVKATAGSGKTTVIRKLCGIVQEMYPTECRILCTVFNKVHVDNWEETRQGGKCKTLDTCVVRHIRHKARPPGTLKLRKNPMSKSNIAKWLHDTQQRELGKDATPLGWNATEKQWAKMIEWAMKQYLFSDLRDCDPRVYFSDRSGAYGTPFGALDWMIAYFQKEVKVGTPAFAKRKCITAKRVVDHYLVELWKSFFTPPWGGDFDIFSKVAQLRTAGCSFRVFDTKLAYIDGIEPLNLSKEYTLVCVDEAQDLNPCKRSLFVTLQLENYGKQSGPKFPFCIVSVGDLFQNIQCYAGATANIAIPGGGKRGIFEWGRQIMCTMTSTFRMGPDAAEVCNLLRERKLVEYEGSKRTYRANEEDSFRVVAKGPFATRVFSVPLKCGGDAAASDGLQAREIDGMKCFESGVRAWLARWFSGATEVPKEVWVLTRSNVGCFTHALAIYQILEKEVAPDGSGADYFNVRRLRFKNKNEKQESARLPEFVLDLLVVLTHDRTTTGAGPVRPDIKRNALRILQMYKGATDRRAREVQSTFEDVGNLWAAATTNATRSDGEEEDGHDTDEGAKESISVQWLRQALTQVLIWCDYDAALGSAVTFCELLVSNAEISEPPANSRWPMIHVKTTHQAKGCENETIWLGGGCFAPYQNNKKDAKSILNVAATRVQKELVLNHEFAKLLKARWGARTKLPVLFDGSSASGAGAAAATGGDEVDTYFS